jgi:Glucose / Sorbosone dehydrogenase
MGAKIRGRWTQCAGIAAVALLAGWTDGVAAPRAPQRLAWTQQSAGHDLRYKIFIDGQAATLAEVSCVDGPDATDCSAPLPDMAPGLHTVAISVVDTFGNESVQSQGLSVTVAAPAVTQSMLVGSTPAASPSSRAAADSARATESVPSRACGGQDCYTVSLIARGEGAISRLEALGDGRVLMLRDGSDVLLLRDGIVSAAYQLHRDDPRSSAIADIAVDPDFGRNHFVYLAVVTTSADASRVRLVRVRETADRLAEAATIVPDLPIAHDVLPRLTVAQDRHVYLAIPVATDGSARQPYDGSILAFTDDGRSLGAAVGSPVLTRGPEAPATLERGAAAQVWIGAVADGLQLFRLSADGSLATARAVDAADAGVVGLAFDRPDHGVLIAATSHALIEFQLSPDGVAFATRRIDLGGLEATALTIPTAGEVVVAARDAANPQSVTLLSLRSSNRAATR